METTERRCTCGEYFTPLLSNQKRCLKCINKSWKGKQIDDVLQLSSPDYAEWLIYHWQMFQRAAEKKYGVSVLREAEQKKPEQKDERGKWHLTDAVPHWVCCSKCYTRLVPNVEMIGRYDIPTNFCPNCGAEMEGMSVG